MRPMKKGNHIAVGPQQECGPTILRDKHSSNGSGHSAETSYRRYGREKGTDQTIE